MDVLQYVLLGVFAFLVIGATVLTIVSATKGKKNKPRVAEKTVEKDGVRYTPNENIETADGNLKVSYVREDILLQPRKMVLVGKKSAVKPGKYTVLSAYENEENFNIRIGNFVKEYHHGQEIVLADGDEICPTSSTIILR